MVMPARPSRGCRAPPRQRLPRSLEGGNPIYRALASIAEPRLDPAQVPSDPDSVRVAHGLVAPGRSERSMILSALSKRSRCFDPQ
eukprot:6359418-Amphidinium_carterae.1